MDSQLEIKLIECLGRLDDGEPLDLILTRFPDDAAHLRPLLETAVALEDLRPAPREPARIASRRAFLAQAHELRESSARRAWLPRRLLAPIAALVIAFICMGGAVAASASALPNEPLYGVKRAVEDAQLLVAGGAQKEQLAARFGQRRRDEINLLLVMRRDTAIAFEGTIERIQPNGWEVSGLYIYLDQATAMAGTAVVGSHVSIQGHTDAGRLLADSVQLDPSGVPVSSPTATATPKPSATARPSVTSIPSPAPQRRATPQPEVTAQPQATAQPTAMPTSTPTRAPTSRPRSTAAPTAAPPTAVPPAAAPSTSEPPASAPPTAAPPTQEGDHGGDNGGDDHGGDNSGSGGSGGGGDNSGSGGGGDNSSGDDHGGDNGGNSGSGGGGGGGDDHGGGGKDKP